VDPRRLGIGIVHIGVGAFHRAHQAQFTEDAIAAAGGDWGISGIAPRSAVVVDQLAPQDGLYTVLTRGPNGSNAGVVGALREVLFAGSHSVDVLARIASPAVRVVTLTVTEKGYRHDPATGRLRRDDEGINADLAGSPPRTVIGLLVRGLQARMAADADPIAVLCCDNLASNGRTLRGLVTEFVDRLPGGQGRRLQSWIADNASFPNCMVDRMVPATTPTDRADVTRLIELDDEAAVVTEPFRQWVIEDDFPAGRPAWDRAGVLLTDDVGAYEVMKLRMLNGAHSALAYLGALAGCETIADAMAREAFAAVAQRLMRNDAEPSLDVPDGFDVGSYERQLVERFANPWLRHRCVQVAMDGSQKLPQRVLATVRARRSVGAEPRWAAFAVAAWMRWVWSEHTDVGSPRVLDDPLAPALSRAVGAATSPAQVVDRLLGVREIFGDDLVADPVVRGLLVDSLQTLTAEGALEAARKLVGEMDYRKERV
jgi:fructuronate reductase